MPLADLLAFVFHDFQKKFSCNKRLDAREKEKKSKREREREREREKKRFSETTRFLFSLENINHFSFFVIYFELTLSIIRGKKRKKQQKMALQILNIVLFIAIFACCDRTFFIFF